MSSEEKLVRPVRGCFLKEVIHEVTRGGRGIGGKGVGLAGGQYTPGAEDRAGWTQESRWGLRGHQEPGGWREGQVFQVGGSRAGNVQGMCVHSSAGGGQIGEGLQCCLKRCQEEQWSLRWNPSCPSASV